MPAKKQSSVAKMGTSGKSPAAKKQGSVAKKQGSAASKKGSSVLQKTSLTEPEATVHHGHEEEEVRGEEQEESQDHLVGVDEQQEIDDDHEEGEDDEEEEEAAEGDAEETMADVTVSTSKVSSSGAANMSKKNTGLVFNCYNVRRKLLRSGRVKKVKSEAAVYMAAVLEYIVAELMEIAGNGAEALKMKTIKPRHIRLAVDEDYDFMELFESAQVVLPGAGVSPRIHAVLSSIVTPDTFRGWNKQGQSGKVLASG